MSDSPWSPLKERKKGRNTKRDAILHTAAQLFVQKGFHSTSLEEVADQLNITKPTLYYYLDSKDDILFECVQLGLELIKSAIMQASEGSGTAADKLRAALASYANAVTMDFGQCLIQVGEDPLPPEKKKALRRLKAEIDREFRTLIEEGIADGSIAPMDPKIAAFTVLGALSWIGRWFKPNGDLSPAQVAEQCTSILMSGLCPRR
ncbi:TetR/AcrR family transcriptional regulator (plasmid) [Agrobacterium leguminum]|uniref:Transcriptional regulator, TetR family n=1 Tax=Agrobacterium deltaense NCPPB 1641 TaxID=1183425 RepID=A0A1S7U730_9HYPH|nr:MULTISPECIES: TetR/AcrR family transcriptional regulator [Agrobacterium]WFS69812.1 TetR/AcrR family transcriptional regulator [Agrobacterium leguminum]CVI62619.1 Transcriptional regulator, TetR family [Agrobacterium deltaense NCPPB 1641]